jgi:hypothetical protein
LLFNSYYSLSTKKQQKKTEKSDHENLKKNNKELCHILYSSSFFLIYINSNEYSYIYILKIKTEKNSNNIKECKI